MSNISDISPHFLPAPKPPHKPSPKPCGLWLQRWIDHPSFASAFVMPRLKNVPNIWEIRSAWWAPEHTKWANCNPAGWTGGREGIPGHQKYQNQHSPALKPKKVLKRQTAPEIKVTKWYKMIKEMGTSASLQHPRADHLFQKWACERPLTRVLQGTSQWIIHGIVWPQGPASHGAQQPQSAHPKLGIRQGGRAGAETDLIHLNGLSELQHLQQSSTQLLIFHTLLIFWS